MTWRKMFGLYTDMMEVELEIEDRREGGG